MNNDITVLILTSPIPSHPSTDILDETIFNTRQYTKAPILILADGVHYSLAHRTEDYVNYIERVSENIRSGKYGDCDMVQFSHHSHQSVMTEVVLKSVKTPLILFNEHDCSIIGDLPFEKICDIVRDSQEINYIRFNIFEKIPVEHSYLMIGKYEEMGILLTRTIQFSARPHIAKTKWYRDFLFTYFHDEKMMIEDRMHSVVASKYDSLGFDTFGLAIYTPEGNQLRSYTSDGRKTDEKIITG